MFTSATHDCQKLTSATKATNIEDCSYFRLEGICVTRIARISRIGRVKPATCTLRNKLAKLARDVRKLAKHLSEESEKSGAPQAGPVVTGRECFNLRLAKSRSLDQIAKSGIFFRDEPDVATEAFGLALQGD
jgi:hypothetical protein